VRVEQTWPEIEDLFFAALEIPAADRDEWIDRAADDWPRLAAEVRSLLEAHAESEAAGPVWRAGPYLPERLLGRGGMGEVWLGARAPMALTSSASQ
jgi:hypothetical protein